jgi:sugar/nucleoside kinase (ribokinase family)
MFDIIVAGEINPDLILSGNVEPAFGQVEKLVDSAVLAIGSSSVIFACGAARLGLKVAFIGKCGDDFFGDFMLAEMKERDVDIGNVIVVPGGSTGLSVILNREDDRAILTSPGLMSTLKAEDIPDNLLRQARHLHVASYFLQESLQPDLHRLFESARALGLTTSLDTNYDPTGQWLGFDELLAVTNVFLPNQTEACSVAREEDVDRAAMQLSVRVDTLAIKLGADGALGMRNAHMVRVPSLPVKVVDTVGAGDSFDAGFVYGYLQGWPLERTLHAATVCGALSTRKSGGTAAQATLDEMLHELS